MTRNKIYAIVEGHGEQKAVGSLISKLLLDLKVWNLYPCAPKYVYRLNAAEFFQDALLEGALRHHKQLYVDCAAVLILLDMDDDCAVEKAQALSQRLQAIPANLT